MYTYKYICKCILSICKLIEWVQRSENPLQYGWSSVVLGVEWFQENEKCSEEFKCAITTLFTKEWNGRKFNGIPCSWDHDPLALKCYYEWKVVWQEDNTNQIYLSWGNERDESELTQVLQIWRSQSPRKCIRFNHSIAHHRCTVCWSSAVPAVSRELGYISVCKTNEQFKKTVPYWPERFKYWASELRPKIRQSTSQNTEYYLENCSLRKLWNHRTEMD